LRLEERALTIILDDGDGYRISSVHNLGLYVFWKSKITDV